MIRTSFVSGNKSKMKVSAKVDDMTSVYIGRGQIPKMAVCPDNGWTFLYGLDLRFQKFVCLSNGSDLFFGKNIVRIGKSGPSCSQKIVWVGAKKPQ